MTFQNKNNCKLQFTFFFFLIFFFSAHRGSSFTRYWIGGTSTAWNNNANWGVASGTGAPASFPTTADTAVFDGGSVSDCSLTANVSITSISLASVFTQTLSQGNYSIFISGNSTWSGGTFLGGSAAIFNAGTFELSGTNFTSSSSSLTLSGSIAYTSGSFNHNYGTVVLSSNSFSVSGFLTFNHLRFVNNYNVITFNNSITIAGNLTLSCVNGWTVFNIASGQALVVNGALFITGNNPVNINTGSIYANGDVMVTNTANNQLGTGTIVFAGNGNQTLTGSGVFNQGNLPNITINKPLGILTLSSFITVVGPSWNYIAGTIAPGTSTVCFYNTYTPYTISGTHTLNNVIFYGNYSPYTVNNDFTATDITLDASLQCVVQVNSSMTVKGTFLLKGSGFFKVNTGSVNLKGNVINNNTNSLNGGGTAAFIVNGTSNQTFTGTAAINQGSLPAFFINKPSGTLFLNGAITFCNGFNWVAGTVDSGTSTCAFNNTASPGSQYIIANPLGMSFYNIVFNQPDYLWTQLSSDIRVAGSVTIAAGSGIKTNNYIIYLGGNFTSLNTTASGGNFVFNGATGCSLVLNGSGPSAQSITSNNPNGTINRALFYNFTVNNTAARLTFDDVVLNDILTVVNTLSLTSGTFLSTNSNYLSLKNGALSNVGNSNSYVNGPMRYEVANNGVTQLNFPVGENGNWRYMRLSINHTTTTSYSYISEVIGSSALALGYSLPSSISHVSKQRYFQIDRVLTSSGVPSSAGLSGNQNIILSYGSNDVVTDFTNLTIAKTNTTGITWIDIGGVASGNTTGTISSTSIPGAFVSFSKFSLANKLGGTNPLPIELLDFSVDPCGTSSCLKWTTASEIRNDFFTVQKSTDGFNFENVGNLKGALESKVQLFYNMVDQHPYTGTSYYRLKQTDIDGQFKYYKIISFFMKPPNNELTISPNPNYGAQFIFTSNTGEMEVLLRNSLGETVATFILFSGSTKVDLSYLSTGIYFATIRKTGTVKKFLVAN